MFANIGRQQQELISDALPMSMTRQSPPLHCRRASTSRQGRRVWYGGGGGGSLSHLHGTLHGTPVVVL